MASAANVVSVIIDGRNQAGPAIEGATVQLELLGDAAKRMATDMETAGRQAEFSIQEAKGTIALMGEEIGVKVPRHIRGFIAELPGVGMALEAAFSATALFVLLDVLVRLGEKLAEWYDKITMTSAIEKEHEEHVKQMTQALDEQAKKLTELQAAYDLVGRSGADLTRAKMAALQAQTTSLEAELSELNSTLIANERQLGDYLDHPLTDFAVSRMTDRIGVVSAMLKTHYQELANLEKERSKQEQAEAETALQKKIAIGQAGIEADKTVAMAEQNLAIANAKLLLQQQIISDEEANRETALAEEQKFHIEVASLERRKKLLETDPTHNVAALRQLNAQLLAVQEEHLAKQESDYAEFLQALNGMRTGQGMKLDFGAAAPVADPVTQLLEAYNQIGIKGTQVFAQQVQTAQDAFNKISQSGVASYTDVLQSEMKLVDAQRLYRQSLGEDSSGEIQVLKDLQAQYDSLTGAVSKGASGMKSLANGLDHAFGSFLTNLADNTKNAGQAFASFGRSVLQALDQMIAKMFVTWALQKALGWATSAIGGIGGAGGGGGVLNPTGGLAGAGSFDMGSLSGIMHGTGGSMRAGELGIVGDMGPELWVPNTSGTVLPFSQTKELLSGGGGTQINHFDLRGSSVTPQDVAIAMQIAEERATHRAVFKVREMNLRRA